MVCGGSGSHRRGVKFNHRHQNQNWRKPKRLRGNHVQCMRRLDGNTWLTPQQNGGMSRRFTLDTTLIVVRAHGRCRENERASLRPAPCYRGDFHPHQAHKNASLRLVRVVFSQRPGNQFRMNVNPEYQMSTIGKVSGPNLWNHRKMCYSIKQ